MLRSYHTLIDSMFSKICHFTDFSNGFVEMSFGRTFMIKSHKIYPKFWFARMHFRARAQNILPPMPTKIWFLNFHSDVRLRARRTRKCARDKFLYFYNYEIHDRISFQFFSLTITQKANFLEQFEDWNFVWIRFSKKFENFEKFEFFLGF